MSHEIKVGSTVGFYVNGEFVIDTVKAVSITEYPSVGPDRKNVLCLILAKHSWVSPEIPEGMPGHCWGIFPAPDTFVTADGVTINPHEKRVYHYPETSTDGIPCYGPMSWDVENQTWIGYGLHFGAIYSDRESVMAHIESLPAERRKTPSWAKA